jgi:hypothetical protein
MLPAYGLLMRRPPFGKERARRGCDVQTSLRRPPAGPQDLLGHSRQLHHLCRTRPLPAASLADLVASLASLASLSLLATAYLASLAIPVTWLRKKGNDSYAARA